MTQISLETMYRCVSHFETWTFQNILIKLTPNSWTPRNIDYYTTRIYHPMYQN